MVKKIAILGPESTGKSVLSIELANRFSTIFVEEYSREYFTIHDYKYNIQDLDFIAEKQLENENKKAEKASNLLICDTEFITFKIWSDIVFNTTSNRIENLIKTHKYDLFLLCNLDVQWKPDPLRNNKHNRKYIYQQFINILEDNNFNYNIVSGTGDNRLENAVNFVNQFLIDE